ncbi:MAG TPA: 16S rRNA (guanine(527)-N(7))-methyltransferase RsmG, partial [Solirubrobacteraceae bacterium]
MSGWRDRLDEIGERHGLDDGRRERLARLLELVRDDPTAPTTVRDPSDAVDVHVADSLVALELEVVRAAQRIADIGAGAGFPGLPLAVALPGARVALVESASRKCTFLRRAIAVTGADNAEVVCARVEEWPERDLDLVCVRALAPLAVIADYAAPLLRIGGHVVAWKGRPQPAEERGGAVVAERLGLRPAGGLPVDPFSVAE